MLTFTLALALAYLHLPISISTSYQFPQQPASLSLPTHIQNQTNPPAALHEHVLYIDNYRSEPAAKKKSKTKTKNTRYVHTYEREQSRKRVACLDFACVCMHVYLPRYGSLV